MKLGSKVSLLGLVLFGLLVGPARALFKIQSYLSGTSRVPATTTRMLHASLIESDTSLVDVFVIDWDTKDFTYAFSADRATVNGNLILEYQELPVFLDTLDQCLECYR